MTQPCNFSANTPTVRALAVTVQALALVPARVLARGPARVLALASARVLARASAQVLARGPDSAPKVDSLLVEGQAEAVTAA